MEHGNVRTRRRTPYRRGGSRPWVIALVAALALVLAPALATLASYLLQTDGASPARGHAQVIAHGVAPMPDEEVAWQVQVAGAEPEGGATIDEQNLGFVHAEEGAILVNDVGLGTQARVAPGEGVFVPQGVEQQRVALGGTGLGYYDITLVPSDNGFRGPDGNVDIDLVRDVLEANEEGELAGGQFPVLLVVTGGSVEVAALGGNQPTTLGSGESDVFTGDREITAGAEGATYVAAVLGPEVPEPPTPPAPPTPTAAPTAAPTEEPTEAGSPLASIALDVAVCPPGYNASDLANDCTNPGAAIGFNLSVGNAFDPNAPVAVSGETDAAGGLVFTELRPSTFVLAADIPGDFAGSFAFCQNAAGTEVAGDTDNRNAVTVAVAAGDEIGCSWYILPDDQRGPTDGGGGPASLTVSFRACPQGQRPETIVGDFCDPAPAGFAATLTALLGGTGLDLTEATPAGPSIFTFADLPFGDYVLTLDGPPPGYDAFLVPGNPCTFADGGTFGACFLTIGQSDIDVNLTVYFFQP